MKYDRDSEEFKQLIEIPLGQLFNPANALKQYGKLAGSIPKAAYGAASGGLKAAGTKAASVVGASPATAAKVGAAVGSPVGVGVAAAAAAAVIYAGYKVYKKYMTDIGKACGASPDRKRCEVEYNLRAKKAQLTGMRDQMGYQCKTRECYASVDMHMNKLKREIAQLQIKLHKMPAPKQPESERNEDEILKGHKTPTQ